MWDKAWNTNKYWSMYNQYACHVDFAQGFKTPWNLEPYTPDKGYNNFLWSQCN
jgi:Protein of unknown function (DUF2599)